MVNFWVRLGTVAAVLAALAPAARAQPPADKSEKLAEVNGVAITAAELDAELAGQLARLHQQLYNLRRAGLEAMIDERLLTEEAARLGISRGQLVEQEIVSKADPVTEADVATYFETNKARLKGDLATLGPQIKATLERQQNLARQKVYLAVLRERANVVTYLKAPAAPRIQLAEADRPSKGPADAPVTIVEFSDFHCPYCKRIQGTIAEILKRYPTQVRLVYRDFPLVSLHPTAQLASEGAQCADDQGRFWEFHDALYAGPPNATPESLKAMATQLGLDEAAFAACLADGRHRASIQDDIREGARHGVSGTPSFFVNGKFLPGAQPLENFVKAIDEELAAAGKTGSQE